jgi:uncharacterized SAM-binding protein YcdF (DUF218 family)
MRFPLKKIWRIPAGIFLFLILLILLKTPILKGIGAYLSSTDELKPCQAIFVLGGGANARGSKAAEVWKKGMAPIVYCLGKPNTKEWQMMGFTPTEPNLTRPYVVQGGVPDSLVKNITQGTSTHEERELILSMARKYQYQCVIVVTSELHTRRVRQHFQERFDRAGVELVLVGAKDTGYSAHDWWSREDGLIFVNNEYIKLIYYKLRH